MDEVTRQALAARAGDDAAAAAFIRATQAQVWRLCARLVDAGAADDLTQDTYLRAFRALPAFRGRSSARTWLLGIARRACMDELRARTRRRRQDSRLGLRLAGESLPDASEQAAADALLAGLPPDQRAAFVLTQILGYSYQEAAEICECPVGTIRSRVARARSDLVARWDAASMPAGPGWRPGQPGSPAAAPPPPGTAPPGTAPPGTAPPGTAPPGTALPGTALPGTAGQDPSRGSASAG